MRYAILFFHDVILLEKNTIFRWHRLVLVHRRIILDFLKSSRAPLPALHSPPIIWADFLYLYIRDEVEYKSSKRNKQTLGVI